VRESAEDLLRVDPVPGEVDLLRPGAGLGRGELAKGTVRPDGVVVPQVLGQHPAQLVFMDDQQPVKDPPAQGADHPFADRVRSRRPRRAGEDPDALRLEYAVEGGGELAGAVRNCLQVGPVRRDAASISASCRICRTAQATLGTDRPVRAHGPDADLR